MSTSGSKSNEHMAHFLVDIHKMEADVLFVQRKNVLGRYPLRQKLMNKFTNVN